MPSSGVDDDEEEDDEDDDESRKKPEVQLSSLSVTADGHTQNQKKATKQIETKETMSEARLLSATSSRQTPTSHSSNKYNQRYFGQSDVAHCNTAVTAEGGPFQEKQSIACRQVLVSISKQHAFAEEATVEETTPVIYDDITKYSTQFEKKGITDGLFYKRAPVDEVTPGTHDDEIKGTQKSDKKAIMDGSKKHIYDMKLAIMPLAHNSHPLKLYSVQSHEPMVSYHQEETTHPGALAMFPTSSVGSVLSTPNDDTISVQDESQSQFLASTGDSGIEAHEPTLKAVLVTEDPGVLASATLLDVEAEKKFHQQRRIRTMVGTLIIASIIAVAVAVPVVLTRPGPSAATFTPSSSPVPSVTPSYLPTVSPSIHPSWVPSSSPSSGLFGFLAVNSFDGGMMLAIAGSSQQRAMDWLLEESGLPEMNYYLLQTYALVTLYFETYGRQWISTADFDEKRLELGSFVKKDSDYIGEWLNITPSVNPNGFCDWQGVLCNNISEIESLNLSSNRLYGSLPAELGMLHQSLSKSTTLPVQQREAHPANGYNQQIF